jgi:hypothetical protein
MNKKKKYLMYLEKGMTIKLPADIDAKMNGVIRKVKEQKPAHFFSFFFRPRFAFAAIILLVMIPTVIFIIGQRIVKVGDQYVSGDKNVHIGNGKRNQQAVYRENVTELFARKISKGVALKWKNPESTKFRNVVIEKYRKGRGQPAYLLPGSLNYYFDRDYEPDVYYVIKCVSIENNESRGIRIEPE